MAGFQIDFAWHRDSKGYRLVDEELPRKPFKKWIEHPTFGRVEVSSSLFDEAGKPAQIVPLGGRRIAYRPLDDFDGLFRQFASVDSNEKLLNFVTKFGPLLADDAWQAGEVRPLLAQAQLMRRVLLAHSSGRPGDLAKVLSSAERFRLANLSASLSIDPDTGAPRLQFNVPHLLHALWLQLGQSIAAGAVVRACQQCGALFDAGPGTGRRLDAKFCSDDHRVTYNSHNRRKEQQP